MPLLLLQLIYIFQSSAVYSVDLSDAHVLWIPAENHLQKLDRQRNCTRRQWGTTSFLEGWGVVIPDIRQILPFFSYLESGVLDMCISGKTAAIRSIPSCFIFKSLKCAGVVDIEYLLG